MTIDHAYARALAADEAWMDAIRRAFPRKRAGDVRYSPEGEGEPGTPLRAAFEAYVEARDAWAAFRTRRIALTHAYRFQRAIDSRLYGDGRGMTRAWMALIEARRDVAAGVKRSAPSPWRRPRLVPLP